MRQIEFEMDGVAVVARLLYDTAPRTTEALWNTLPLTGSGDEHHLERTDAPFLGQGWGPGEVPIKLETPEKRPGVHWPGCVYYHPAWRGIRICYGQAQQSGSTSVSTLTPVAKFTGDWTAFKEKAKAILFEGPRR